LAGRAFTATKVVTGDRTDHRPLRLWVPLLDGTERMGVARFDCDAAAERSASTEAELVEGCRMLASLVGHLLAAKLPYGDSLQQLRRSEPMSAASELLFQLLPPLTFSCDRAVISAVLEPCYRVGGDAFDYSVDGSTATVSVLDAMGHGARAGLTAAVALATMRAARRDGQGLYSMACVVDEALPGQFSDVRFVTGVLAELNLDSGRLRYVNAGHPAPLVLRRTKVVRTLGGGRRRPLGLEDPTFRVAEEYLEPGDRLLLYTDGVTEARAATGEAFGTDRLIDLAEQHAAAGLGAAETLRRLSHSITAHQAGTRTDDATLLLLEWRHSADPVS
jgi:sigma-B regulation protein RsbU (phosphoserine phosphatase)